MSRDNTQDAASGSDGTSSNVLQRGRSSPASRVLSGLLSLIVLALIFGAIIPALGDYQAVWDTITGISPARMAGLVGIFLVAEASKAVVPVIILPALTLPKSIVAEETSSVISNAIPGPSGTATRFAIYQSWGLDGEAFGRATVVNSVMNNACLLLMPILVLVPIATQYHVRAGFWWVAGICAAISVIGTVVLLAIMRNERFARWLGATMGRFVTWFRGLRHRPPPEDMGRAVVEFRDTITDVLRRSWLSLSVTIIVKYLLMALLLAACVRAVGVDAAVLPAGLIFGAYVFGRVLSMIEITPGGIGVTEVIYISLLQLASRGQADDQIVAAVFLFRAFTYLGPMILGLFGYVIWRGRKSWRVSGRAGSPDLFRAGVEVS